MHVLVVEDDPSIREGLCELLAEVGRIRSAATVKEGEALLSSEVFDLVLADIRIGGDRRGGRKLVRASRLRLTPVAVMSALTAQEIQEELVSEPPDQVLLKPFQIDDVLGLVERHAARRRQLEALARCRDGRRAQLSFVQTVPGLEVAVDGQWEGQEVRWYRLAPRAQVDFQALERTSGLLVEGTLEVDGVRRLAGNALQLTAGWPVCASSVEGALGVGLVG